jgi:hypothetical protein
MGINDVKNYEKHFEKILEHCVALPLIKIIKTAMMINAAVLKESWISSDLTLLLFSIMNSPFETKATKTLSSFEQIFYQSTLL